MNDGYSNAKNVRALIQLHKTAKKYRSITKMKAKKIDLPELLSRLQVLNFNLQVLEKELSTQIENVQSLFGVDEKIYSQKINTVLTNLEYFVNVALSSKIEFFKSISKQIKKVGSLN